MYILYVLSAIVPSDFYSIEFLLIFYNNCLGFEIISDTQKATSVRWLFITDSIIGNTNDHIAPVFFFTGFLYNITGYPTSCIYILYCIAYYIKTDF